MEIALRLLVLPFMVTVALDLQVVGRTKKSMAPVNRGTPWCDIAHCVFCALHIVAKVSVFAAPAAVAIIY